MRSRLLPLALSAFALLALPAAAPAAVTVGIAENNPQLFGDPLFSKLGAKHSRLVVSWNVMTARNDEINRVIDYIAGAQAAGVRPLVTFEHARGDATICNKRKNRRKAQCKLPSAKAYEKNLKLFRNAFPYVRDVVAWNEINHFTQPTYKNPKAAARFTTIARKLFKGKTVVTADILDQADNTRAKRPTFRSATRYVKAFRRYYKGPRKICGVHNYSDINRFRSTGTKAIIKALGCKQIWLTEAGGIYKFSRFKASQKRQLKATKYMFKLARTNKRIKRLYVYTWFGGVTSRFDAGLVANGKARKAYAEVRKRVK
jgi:Glycosyl hydrolase catalytic core